MAIIWPALAPTQGTPIQLIPGLCVIDDFFSKATLKRWTAFLTAPDTPIQLVSSPPAKAGEALRTNSRFAINDVNFANSLWTDTALQGIVTRDETFKSKVKGRKCVGLNSNIRLYRYDKGEQFKSQSISPSLLRPVADASCRTLRRRYDRPNNGNEIRVDSSHLSHRSRGRRQRR